MLKRDTTDELYSIVVKRYKEEYPDIELSKDMIDGIWYSLHGILLREGKEAAYQYAQTGKLNYELCNL